MLLTKSYNYDTIDFIDNYERIKEELDYYKNLDYEYMQNTYSEYIRDNYGSNELTTFDSTATSILSDTELIKLLASPDANRDKIASLITFHLYTNSQAGVTIDIPASLPSLNFKLDALEKGSGYDKDMLIIRKTLRQIKHKVVVRQILTQCLTEGTVCGMISGSKKEPTTVIFQDLRYFFPSRWTGQNTWEVICDLEYFNKYEDIGREAELERYAPHITEAMYQAYKRDPSKRYVSLPTDATFCISTKTYKAQQRFGISWVENLLLDVNFKSKMKDMDKSIADKFIKNLIVLQFGNEVTKYKSIGKIKRRSILSGVKRSLNPNSQQNISVVGIPDYVKMESIAPKVNIDESKYNNVNKDINLSTGGMKGLIEGTATFSAGKNIIQINYQKLVPILEQIEYEFLGKLINWIVPKAKKDYYYIEYVNKPPMETKAELTFLMQLADKGFAVKPILDKIEGVEYFDYINQTRYEQDVLKLNQTLIPPSSAHTQSASNGESGSDGSNETDETSESKEKNLTNGENEE